LLAVSIATALVIWAFARPLHYETGVAEMRDVTLPDGSVLTLGGRTAVDVYFNAGSRHATLREGEVFLSVHPDAQRPFFVAVGNTEIRVVGTKFDVRRGDEQIQVSVLEGVVEVRQAEAGQPAAASSPTASKVLSHGQQLTATVQGELGDAHQVGAAVAGGWRTGRRVYIDTPLREIVADANRYSRERIVLDDAELAQLRVSVSFRAENLQQMFNGLALALPLEIERQQVGRIVLHARP
jgi:transmembrane sensor